MKLTVKKMTQTVSILLLVLAIGLNFVSDDTESVDDSDDLDRDDLDSGDGMRVRPRTDLGPPILSLKPSGTARNPVWFRLISSSIALRWSASAFLVRSLPLKERARQQAPKRTERGCHVTGTAHLCRAASRHHAAPRKRAAARAAGANSRVQLVVRHHYWRRGFPCWRRFLLGILALLLVFFFRQLCSAHTGRPAVYGGERRQSIERARQRRAPRAAPLSSFWPWCCEGEPREARPELLGLKRQPYNVQRPRPRAALRRARAHRHTTHASSGRGGYSAMPASSKRQGHRLLVGGDQPDSAPDRVLKQRGSERVRRCDRENFDLREKRGEMMPLSGAVRGSESMRFPSNLAPLAGLSRSNFALFSVVCSPRIPPLRSSDAFARLQAAQSNDRRATTAAAAAVSLRRHG